METLKSLLLKMGSIYFEPVESINLAAGATVKRTFTNQDNIPYLIQKMVGYGEDNLGAKSFKYKIAFKDSGRSQLLMSNSIHGSALGSGEFPTVLPVPYLLRGSSTFEVDITNLDVNPMNIYLTFIGVKVGLQS